MPKFPLLFIDFEKKINKRGQNRNTGKTDIKENLKI